nr:hypothetical protein CFP56_52744 [Quercus suber]
MAVPVRLYGFVGRDRHSPQATALLERIIIVKRSSLCCYHYSIHDPSAWRGDILVQPQRRRWEAPTAHWPFWISYPCRVHFISCGDPAVSKG